MKRRSLFWVLIAFSTYTSVDAQSFFSDANVVLPTDTSAAGNIELEAADLNGDGNVDFISVASLANTITLFLGDGIGGFGPEQTISDNFQRPNEVLAADLDGDGDMDVIASSQLDNKISCFFNDGSSGFGLEQVITTAIIGIEDVHAGDVDGDGDIDVLSASVFDDKAAWYANDGSGSFGTQQVISISSSGTNYITTFDIDRDGDQDVFTTAQYAGSVVWYANNGSGNFGPQQFITTEVQWPTSVNLVKIDGDDFEDAVVFNINSSSMTYLSGDGMGNFSAPVNINENFFGIRPEFADLDLDGDVDLMTGERPDGIVYSLNDGEGNFGGIIDLLFNNATSAVIADVNGDDFPDIISGSESLPRYAWFENLLGKPSISGKIFYDGNGNGTIDGDEGGIGTIPLRINPNALLSFTDADGNFKFNLDPGEYTVSPLSGENWLLTTDYAEAEITVTDTTYVDTLLFGYEPAFYFHEANLQVASGFVRCNTEVPFQLILTNTGTSVLSGQLQLASFDHLELIEESIEPPFTGVENDTTYWEFEDLQPGSSFIVHLDFLVDGVENLGDSVCVNISAAIPVQEGEVTLPSVGQFRDADKVPICHCTGSVTNPYVFLEVAESAVDGEGNNDHTHHECDIIPITDLNDDGEIDEDDCYFEAPDPEDLTYSFTFKKEILCSLDPNDKLAEPDGEGEDHLTLFGQDIIYTIRFQNTGNDTAFYVLIVDTLDQNLDVSTFSFITSSHDVEVSVQETNGGSTNILLFEFDDIVLPDSTTDYPGSNGYVIFSIQPVTELTANTIITNSAAIIFDQNPAIITNKTWNTMVASFGNVTGISLNGNEISALVFPNPFTRFTELIIEDPLLFKYDLRVMDVSGKVVRSYHGLSGQKHLIDRDDLRSGIYIIGVYRWGSDDLLGVTKVIVK